MRNRGRTGARTARAAQRRAHVRGRASERGSDLTNVTVQMTLKWPAFTNASIDGCIRRGTARVLAVGQESNGYSARADHVAAGRLIGQYNPLLGTGPATDRAANAGCWHSKW